jgi:hypothetical protein
MIQTLKRAVLASLRAGGLLSLEAGQSQARGQSHGGHGGGSRDGYGGSRDGDGGYGEGYSGSVGVYYPKYGYHPQFWGFY